MRHIISAIIFLTLLAGSLAGAATKYVIKDLGTLQGALSSRASAINNKGQVVAIGSFQEGNHEYQPEICRTFLWENGRLREIKMARKDKEVFGSDINNKGQILVGGMKDSFIYHGGSFKKIEPLPGCVTANAVALNNQTDVIGWCDTKDGEVRPFFRRNGVMKALPTGMRCTVSLPLAINSRGQAVGTLQETRDRRQCVMWENGKLKGLKGLGKDDDVISISDDGTVAGFHWDDQLHRAFVWRNGVVKYLDLPDSMSWNQAECINSAHTLVGGAENLDGYQHAVLWDADGILTELPTHGGRESWAYAINDAGVVVGMAQGKDGKQHPVMWTPVK